MEKPNTCLNPECNAKAHVRGLCSLCYQAANRLVKLKKTTWDTLEKAGKALQISRSKPGKRMAWLLND